MKHHARMGENAVQRRVRAYTGPCLQHRYMYDNKQTGLSVIRARVVLVGQSCMVSHIIQVKARIKLARVGCVWLPARTLVRHWLRSFSISSM